MWDLYSGIGSIALALAGKARQVIGVEIAEEAVERARENASLNGVGNVEFVAGDAAKTVRPLLERGLPKPDVVVRRPAAGRALARRPSAGSSSSPRAGSCTSRATRRRSRATGCCCRRPGYRLERVRPFDLFPHTPHVECVARFERVAE